MKVITDITVYDIEKRRFPEKHYEYVIRVKWSDDVVNVVYRRYSQFYQLHSQLIDLFPVQGGVYRQTDRTIPYLPGKILFGRSHIRKVALDRLQPISDYCKGLLKLPNDISTCNLVRQFFDAGQIDLLPRESVKRLTRESKKSIKSISQPITLEQYEVLLDYSKEEQSELSIRAGSVVDVIEKRDTGWWFVKGDADDEGWVPSSYLQKRGSQEDNVLPLSDSESLKFICTRSYEPQEVDEIQLHKGCQVEVLEKNLDGWWLIRYMGRIGRAPAIYLSRTDTLKAYRVRDFQQMAKGDAVSDDFSGSSLDDFSSSDNSTENLNLSWEAQSDQVTHQVPALHNNGYNAAVRKPLRPPPPVPDYRKNTAQLPFAKQSPVQTQPEGLLGKIAMFNKNMSPSFQKPPEGSNVVRAKVDPSWNMPQHNYPVSSAIKAPVRPKLVLEPEPRVFNAVKPKPDHFRYNQASKESDGPVSSPKVRQIGGQVPSHLIQQPEFCNIRLKPVQVSSNSGPATTGDSGNGKPILPPKPKLH